ncbi:hypothetical protein [Algoriphagus boritolerans]|uniref:Uncharacterized protein n=1 Tax=Algoriphagus boritolerans DSM 17298 = JCM 18970 TaxID=1120964 RepID=A0A1H5VBX8_9BACT|nr:hypothetical protein [Algoriphagus boritolerans]SEF84809.1 hypothetical protein SAMN03080598_01644 [Algoriphagus boritolerans DSM 17298 = JCM 18970]
MLEDLEQDRKALQEGIRFMEEKDQNMEEFLRLLHTPGEVWDTVSFYKSMTMFFSTFPFSPTDGTYSQMKYPCRTVDTQEHDYLGVFSR